MNIRWPRTRLRWPGSRVWISRAGARGGRGRDADAAGSGENLGDRGERGRPLEPPGPAGLRASLVRQTSHARQKHAPACSRHRAGIRGSRPIRVPDRQTQAPGAIRPSRDRPGSYRHERPGSDRSACHMSRRARRIFPLMPSTSRLRKPSRSAAFGAVDIECRVVPYVGDEVGDRQDGKLFDQRLIEIVSHGLRHEGSSHC